MFHYRLWLNYSGILLRYKYYYSSSLRKSIPVSLSSRNSELFAGEIWQVLYQAFTSINFNASDPASINQALQSYIQANYSENFADWIVSSEFVMLIDLLSWLAGTLAYKTDLSVRENFIDTAEARSSILRLARFLSYNPSRNQCAQGILKLDSVSTTDNVFDSFGNNLVNIKINWNDPDNSNWLEQFTTVLNDAFVSTNPFGVPLNNGTVQGVNVQLYRVNGLYSASQFAFSATVGGSAMSFEICNADFTDGGNLFELTPNPNLNAFQFYYLNDGNGNSSPQTGFCLLFKQGTTQSDTFSTQPDPNQVLTSSGTNVNNTDVWVQTIDNTGNVLTTWTQIPVMLDENITYNSLPIDERNIYSVITLDNDGISVRFSDGEYGNSPSGNIKLSYRVSNGLTYSIAPQDITGISIPVSYLNTAGIKQTLTLTFSLYSQVSNAVATETIEQIRFRAPQVYQTQNRMVSGEDYNSFPLQTNLALKLKAVNRVYSGQSRYIDLNDPTGTYQDLVIFVDDGIMFQEQYENYVEIPINSVNFTSNQFIATYIQTPLLAQDTLNAFQNIMMNAIYDGVVPVPEQMVWVQSNASLFSSTGYFTLGSSSLIQQGAMVQFLLNNETFWVGINEINGNYTSVPALNTAGPVVLSEIVPSGSVVVKILPVYNATLTNDNFNSNLLTTMSSYITSNLSFSLLYDYNQGDWAAIGNAVPNLNHSIQPGTTQILMLSCNYMSGIWQVTTIGCRYVFESISTIEWFDSGFRAIDQQTGQASMDLVRVLPVNQDLNNPAGYALNENYDFSIDKLWFYLNGYPEPRRTVVNFADANYDGFPDNPDSFIKIINQNNEQNNYLFWQVGTDENLHPNYSIVVYDSITDMNNSVPNNTFYGNNIQYWNALSNIPALTSGGGTNVEAGTYYTVSVAGSTNLDGNFVWNIGDVVVFNGIRWTKAPVIGGECFVLDGSAMSSLGLYDNTFWIYNGPLTSNSGGFVQDTSQNYAYEYGRGPNVASVWNATTGTTYPSGNEMLLQWKHYAPSSSRIDPSSQNIIDMFVLTYSYDTAVRQWLDSGAEPASEPLAPTELDLRLAFESMENYRMFSDALVWRPVSYKYLFGSNADPSVQYNFKVIRIPNASVSNGAIQSNVINAINTYFDAKYWDFGETFYWSELAAYIHQQLAGQIASIVLVPTAANAFFGDGFEISSRPDEIFISTAQVSNVIIIDSNTPANLRIS